MSDIGWNVNTVLPEAEYSEKSVDFGSRKLKVLGASPTAKGALEYISSFPPA